MRNLRKLCSDEEVFDETQSAYVKYFSEHAAPQYLIAGLPGVSFVDERRQVLARALQSQMWLVLPYHPSLVLGGLQKAMDEFNEDKFWPAVFSTAMGQAFEPKIKISWCNALSSLSGRLRVAGLSYMNGR